MELGLLILNQASFMTETYII